MIRACNHDVGDNPQLLCIVDDPSGGLDPALVVQTSISADITGARNTIRFVEFIGDLDGYTAFETEEVLSGVADATHDVIVDLAGVAFCDSAGLRLIERFHDRFAQTADGSRSTHRAEPLSV